MAKFAPSILSADFYKLGIEIESALNIGADWIHVDVMDGHFVPPLTYGAKIVSDIKKNNKDVFCDVHLMVTNPENHIQPFIDADADLINFHYEAAVHGDRIIEVINKAGKKSGVTINPATPVSVLEYYLPLVDLVLIMSVNPGYSSQSCIDYNFKKIKELKKIRQDNNYKYLIQIDGGISSKNITKPLNAGADVIVAGSGFFGITDEKRKEFINIIHCFK